MTLIFLPSYVHFYVSTIQVINCALVVAVVDWTSQYCLQKQ